MEFNFKKAEYLTKYEGIKEATSVMYKILSSLKDSQRHIILDEIFQQLDTKLFIDTYDE